MGRVVTFLDRAARRYGRRGGSSATAGKTSATYIVYLPNGRAERKRTFKASREWACAAIYEYEGTWYIAGVYDVVPEKMKSYARVTAERVG